MSMLEGKKALITGGAQGLGEALTERLAREGAVAVAPSSFTSPNASPRKRVVKCSARAWT